MGCERKTQNMVNVFEYRPKVVSRHDKYKKLAKSCWQIRYRRLHQVQEFVQNGLDLDMKCPEFCLVVHGFVSSISMLFLSYWQVLQSLLSEIHSICLLNYKTIIITLRYLNIWHLCRDTSWHLLNFAKLVEISLAQNSEREIIGYLAAYSLTRSFRMGRVSMAQLKGSLSDPSVLSVTPNNWFFARLVIFRSFPQERECIFLL